MPIEVTMPKLSPTMETGVIAQWLVKVGDKVKEGDVLADIETDKATMPMKSYDDGTIVHIDHAAGEEVALGQRVLVLAKKGEDPKRSPRSLGLGQARKAAAAGGKAEGQRRRRSRRARLRPQSHSAGNGQQTAAAEPPQAAGGGRRQGQPAGPQGGRGGAASTSARCAAPGPAAGSSAATSRRSSRGEPQAGDRPAAPRQPARPRPRGKAAARLGDRRRWPPSASPTRGCARRSPSGCRRPSRPLPRST